MDVGIPRSPSLLPVSKDYPGNAGEAAVTEDSSLLLQAAASPNLLQDLITCVLVSSGREVIFFTVAPMVLRFRFVTKTVLITH